MLIRDQNEAPIATWTVFLDSNDNGRLESGETSTQTDAQGKYSFADLPKGNYTVSQVLTLGWSNTFPKVAAQSSNVLTPATVLTTTMPMPSVVGGTDASTENFP
jgi:Carboxypeptidase regulatory-like domain